MIMGVAPKGDANSTDRPKAVDACSRTCGSVQPLECPDTVTCQVAWSVEPGQALCIATAWIERFVVIGAVTGALHVGPGWG